MIQLCVLMVLREQKKPVCVLVEKRQLDLLFRIGKVTPVNTCKCKVALENVCFQTA